MFSYKLPAITTEEIRLFRTYIYELTGIQLGKDKGYLFENRFATIMEELQATSFLELYNLSSSSSSCKKLERRLIDAITTHETSFFRDNAPYELLKQKIIPDLIAQRNRNRLIDSVPMPLSIWCTACSTGQEVYSIAIVLKEVLGNFEKYRIKLLGTDISEKALKKAISGKYSDFEMARGLSTRRMFNFFQKTEDCWTIHYEIKALTSFRRVNLIDSFDELGKFDIIFCRNVATYFSQEARQKFFRRIAKTMRSEGYLIVGSTESLVEMSELFIGTQLMGASFYQLCSR